MISPQLRAHILRLHTVEKWKVHPIAKQLGLHHATVRNALHEAGVSDAVQKRPSKTDPFIPFVHESLQRYPDLTASRLLQMVRERGYVGGPSHFRALVSRLRPRPTPEAFLRRQTLAGEEAQVDWGAFGKVLCGRALRKLSAFVMVLSQSRMLYVRFFLSESQSLFLRGHQLAFEFFGGVPRVLLYDNLKSAVLERIGDAIRFHPGHWDFAMHHGFEPRPVAVRRGNEKGRVERAIGYLRTSFFPARTFSSLQQLNEQALAFCNTEAAARRCPEDPTLSVGQAWELEKPLLLPLPQTPFPIEERLAVRAGKTPYIRFDKNDYSIPHTAVRRTLTVLASEDCVRIVDGTQELAVHPRSFDQGTTVENDAHIEALRREKRRAKEPAILRRLTLAAPAAQDFFHLLAARGGALGAALGRMERLLDQYGPAELQAALVAASDLPNPQLYDIQLLLDQRKRQLSLPPPLGLHLPADSPLRAVSVTPHPLASYDSLHRKKDDSHDPR